MDIYIDNEKTRLGKRTKDFEKILKSINKTLEKKEKIIKSISINGTLLYDGVVIDMTKDNNIIEVETKSYVDLTLESLENLKEYTKTFFEVKNNLQELLEENEEISMLDIEETNAFLVWFADLIYLLTETYTFPFSDLEEILFTVREEVEVLLELKEKNDYIGYVLNLDICISDILKSFCENIDYYKNTILEEEENKKILF
ncbi:chemotaxis protein [Fusobacterium massiliense]|uniref:chemotaxis protein n=1 Tax=Fusobacterium massiliense TaxID=1852365 RepID=UPI00093E53E7|nr:chemotaxis protein [Fusobacterium massiliense]